MAAAPATAGAPAEQHRPARAARHDLVRLVARLRQLVAPLGDVPPGPVLRPAPSTAQHSPHRPSVVRRRRLPVLFQLRCLSPPPLSPAPPALADLDRSPLQNLDTSAISAMASRTASPSTTGAARPRRSSTTRRTTSGSRCGGSRSRAAQKVRAQLSTPSRVSTC